MRPSPQIELRIGVLARRCGLSPDSLRHYERIGLLSARRSPGRFRIFGSDAQRRVEVIQAALAIGFTLTELSALFAERAAGRPPCRRVRALAGEKLIALKNRIDHLRAVEVQLTQTLEQWDEQLKRTQPNHPAGLLDLLARRVSPVQVKELR